MQTLRRKKSRLLVFSVDWVSKIKRNFIKYLIFTLLNYDLVFTIWYFLLMSKHYTNQEVKLKLEHFCAYQERCHMEVIQKLRSMAMDSRSIDEIVVHLIENQFLNEERFARSFARGKHRIKFWGNIRIINELKTRNISQTNITTALKEIGLEEYSVTFDRISERYWESISEKNILKKRKKFCDFMLRKGYESHLIYEKVKQLEKG